MITRIKPPKFKVGRNVLNEYELRLLMVEVARGLKPAGIKVKEGNIESTILESGRLSNNLPGLAIASQFTIDLLRLNRSHKLV
jgi:hypothetical protein